MGEASTPIMRLAGCTRGVRHHHVAHAPPAGAHGATTGPYLEVT